MKTIRKEVGEYLEYCKTVRRMSEVTITAKRNVLRRFVRVTGVSGLNELTNERFNEWVSVVGAGVSAHSLNTYNAVVIAMVRYYRDLGAEIPLNLGLVTRLKWWDKGRKHYTEEEVAQAVAVADEVEALWIMILFETGMRIAELTRMRVGDLVGRRIDFIGKGRKPREVYLKWETLARVREYIVRYRLDGYLWCVCDGVRTLNGEPMTVNTVRARLKKTFERAGMTGFYPHALRHSFATDLQRKGASVAEIKEMMGHSNIATTERYLHGFEGKLEELFNKYR